MSSLSMVPSVLRSAPAATARSLAMPWAAAMASRRVMSLKIWSHSPDTWAMAAPTALAQSPCSTWITFDTPRSGSGATEAPPPTAIHRTAAATDGNQRHVARFGLHAVDRLLGHACGFAQHLSAESTVEMDDLPSVAQIQQARRHGDIRRGELLAAEGNALSQQPIADRYRSH